MLRSVQQYVTEAGNNIYCFLRFNFALGTNVGRAALLIRCKSLNGTVNEFTNESFMPFGTSMVYLGLMVKFQAEHSKNTNE